MTVQNPLSRIPYVATGGELQLPIPFTIQRTEDLTLIRTQSGGTAETLVYGTHYSIPYSTLGALTGVLQLTTPATAGDSFLLVRLLDILQELSLRTTGTYMPEATELELDRIVMMILQHEVLLSSLDPTVARALLLDPDAVVGSGAYNGLSNRIRNLDNGVDQQDAVTVSQMSAAIGGIVAGGGGSFISLTVTAAGFAALNPANFDGLVVRIRDAALPDILKVGMRQSNATFGWETLIGASS